MTLQEDIQKFKDGNGLVCPDDQTGSTYKRGSDNGVTHSSRYLILQKLNEEKPDSECLLSVLACKDEENYVHRAPDDATEDTPDDYYSLISMLSVLGLTHIKVKLPWKCCHPMLLYMREHQKGLLRSLLVDMAFTWTGVLVGLSTVKYLGWLAILLQLIIVLAPGIVIALSNLKADSDAMLTWNLIQGTKNSAACILGAKIWYLRHDVQKLFEGYYPNNPMANKQWKKV